jgi:hypothetical protein
MMCTRTEPLKKGEGGTADENVENFPDRKKEIWMLF